MDTARIYANKLRNEYDSIEINAKKTNICEELSNYYIQNKMYDSAMYYQKEMTYLVQKIYQQISSAFHFQKFSLFVFSCFVQTLYHAENKKSIMFNNYPA